MSLRVALTSKIPPRYRPVLSLVLIVLWLALVGISTAGITYACMHGEHYGGCLHFCSFWQDSDCGGGGMVCEQDVCDQTSCGPMGYVQYCIYYSFYCETNYTGCACWWCV